MSMLVFGAVNKHISAYTLRIAVCIDGPKRFAANARQLLGKEAIKQRHLKILGYEVVQVSVITRYNFCFLPIHLVQIVLICKIAVVGFVPSFSILFFFIFC